MMDSAPDEFPFQQVIPSIPQQSLYPSLTSLGTSLNTAVSPPIPFSRRVINDIEEQQRKALKIQWKVLSDQRILPLLLI